MAPRSYQFDRRTPRTGLTLVEVAFSSLLVGLLVVGSLQSVGAVWRARRATADRTNRMMLAEELMQEIASQPLVDPVAGKTTPFGVDPGESNLNRIAFDDADDYDNWSASPPKSRDGTVRVEFPEWTRSVLVDHVSGEDATSVVSDGSGEQGVRRITVTVVDAEGRTTSLVAIRGLLADAERAPDTPSASSSTVGLVLRVGTGAPVRSTTDVRGEALDQ